jgi:hypothetical protein
MGKLALLVVGLAACSAAPGVSGDDVDAGDDVPVADAAPDPEYSAVLDGCDDALETIWVTPGGLPPLTDTMRGDVIRCAPGLAMDAAGVAAALDGASGVETTTGVRLYKIAYRTVRGDGSAAVTTATVWLPETPRALPAPVALVARSTNGIADECAPSREDNPLHELALPFAARGYVVITPDLAGLGNEGVHAYLDNHEAANQLFDGARALEKLAGAGVIGDAELAAGYSQGGGVVLSAQALEQEITGARTLRAVIAIAPEWPIRIGSFDYDEVLRNPDRATGLAGLGAPAVTVLRHYGWAVNHLGAERGGETFPSDERADLIDEIESNCTIELGYQLGTQQPKLGDLVDESFRVAMLACIDGTPGCTGIAADFHAWLASDYVTADPAGADVLIVQGLGDQIMPAAEEAACVADKLRDEGVDPTICSDTWSTHDTILENKIEHAVAWGEAAADGTPRPTCSTFLPPCED